MSYAQLDKLKKATAILSIWLRKGGTGKSLEPLQKLEKTHITCLKMIT